MSHVVVVVLLVYLEGFKELWHALERYDSDVDITIALKCT